MDTEKIYKHAPDCLPEDMGGEILVYSPSMATTLHLNGPSAIVWGLCTGEHTVREMIDAVTEVYPDQAKQIEDDIAEVVIDLSNRGFLVETQSASETSEPENTVPD